MKLRPQGQAGLSQIRTGKEQFLCKGPEEERAEGMRAPERQAVDRGGRTGELGTKLTCLEG